MPLSFYCIIKFLHSSDSIFSHFSSHCILLLRFREKIQKVKIENKILEVEYQKNKKLLDEANASKVRDTRNMKIFKKVTSSS